MGSRGGGGGPDASRWRRAARRRRAWVWAKRTSRMARKDSHSSRVSALIPCSSSPASPSPRPAPAGAPADAGGDGGGGGGGSSEDSGAPAGRGRMKGGRGFGRLRVEAPIRVRFAPGGRAAGGQPTRKGSGALIGRGGHSGAAARGRRGGPVRIVGKRCPEARNIAGGVAGPGCGAGRLRKQPNVIGCSGRVCRRARTGQGGHRAAAGGSRCSGWIVGSSLHRSLDFRVVICVCSWGTAALGCRGACNTRRRLPWPTTTWGVGW